MYLGLRGPASLSVSSPSTGSRRRLFSLLFRSLPVLLVMSPAAVPGCGPGSAYLEVDRACIVPLLGPAIPRHLNAERAETLIFTSVSVSGSCDKAPRPGGLNDCNLFSPGSGGWEPEVRCEQG